MSLFKARLRFAIANSRLAAPARRLRGLILKRRRTEMAAVAQDVADFAERHPWLRGGREREQPGRVVLVLSYNDYPAQNKSESVIAKALQLRGLRPVFVTQSATRDACRYYRAFGYRDFIDFDRVEPRRPTSEMILEVDRLFAATLGVHDLLDYQYRGARLGARLLRTLARTTYSCDFRLHDPTVRAFLRDVMLQGMVNVMRAERIVEQWKPELVMCHHPLNLGEGEVFDVALDRGVNTIFWDEAQKAACWLFTRVTTGTRDVQTFSVSAPTWEKAKHLPWTPERDAELMAEIRGRYDPDSRNDIRKLQDGKRVMRPEEVVATLGIDPAKKTAVVFAHIAWDTSFFHGRDLFETYEEWLVETVRVAAQNPSVNWIVKLHPANLMKLQAERVSGEASEITALRTALGELPSHIRLLPSDTPINTWSLLSVMDYGLTVRGTIGVEVPCLGIPLLTAGTGRYSGRGFTVDSATREEYLERVRNIEATPPLSTEQITLAKRHAYVLFAARMQPWSFMTKTIRSKKELGHALYTNYEIGLTSLEEFEARPEIQQFADWALNSRELDMVDWAKLR